MHEISNIVGNILIIMLLLISYKIFENNKTLFINYIDFIINI